MRSGRRSRPADGGARHSVCRMCGRCGVSGGLRSARLSAVTSQAPRSLSTRTCPFVPQHACCMSLVTGALGACDRRASPGRRAAIHRAARVAAGANAPAATAAVAQEGPERCASRFSRSGARWRCEAGLTGGALRSRWRPPEHAVPVHRPNRMADSRPRVRRRHGAGGQSPTDTCRITGG
jgi:hypothetical protein